MADQPVVAILLRSPDRSRRLVAILAERKLQAKIANSSDELHRLIVEQPVQAIAIEQALGGFLTGLEIASRLQDDLTRPPMVIVGDLSVSEQETAERLRVRPVSGENGLEPIAAALMACVSHQTVSRSLIPFPARQLAAGADVVPPLPQLLTKLCSHLESETASLGELTEILSVDPRVTGELLKLTNGAAMGLGRKVTSLNEAVALLGMRRTVATVLATGVLKAQAELLRSAPTDIRRWYNSRSVLIAGTAASFAERLEQISAETAHVLGLFQDLGCLILARTESRSYPTILKRATSIAQTCLEGLEGEEYGITHADVSAALLEQWEVPASLVSLVLDHHPSQRRTGFSDLERKFLRTMQVGEAVANMADAPGIHRHRRLASLLEQYGTRQSDKCHIAMSQGVARALESSRLFSIPIPDEAVLQDLLAQISTDDLHERVLSREPVAEVVPAHVAPVFAAVAAGAAPIPEGSRARILVVDDEQQVLNAMVRMLDFSGFEVVPCQSASDVPSLARDVDAIVCDIHLGGSNGIEVIRQLRNSGIQVPIIVVSGDHRRSTVLKSIEAGIVGYLVKPFSRDTLVQVLHKHLDGVIAHPRLECDAGRPRPRGEPEPALHLAIEE